MKKRTVPGYLALAAISLSLSAQGQESDSLHYNLQEVEITSVRASETPPVAFTNIGHEEIKRRNTGIDLPYLISFTPGAVATSDAGAGIGYTSL